MPAIIGVEQHGFSTPAGFRLSPPQQGSCDNVVSVAKYVGPDLDPLSGYPFNGVTTSVDDGVHVLDKYSAVATAGKGSTHVSTMVSDGANAPLRGVGGRRAARMKPQLS
jgi:hypothetical protein